jgi:mono/diheme cytochrome c family protein
MANRKSTMIAVTAACLAVAAAVFGSLVWYHLFRRVPTHYDSDVEHFKYGSVGIEEPAGIPYWIWMVLPRMFPEKLPGPGGYASLGMVWEEGKEMPVGFPVTTIGIPRVGANCATCHTTSVRTSVDDAPMLIPAGPAHQFDIQAYQRFLIACAKDPRFTPGAVLHEIEKNYEFSFIERMFYRYAIIPATRKGLLQQDRQFAWMNVRPDWGPGRTDMDPFKLNVLELHDDRSVGNTDMMAIWNERAHEGFLRHSDGLESSLIEATYSAALASGATAQSIDIAALQRVNNWLLTVPPPRYPLPIERALADRGKTVFDRSCASCHAFGQARAGKVIPLDEVGTDRSRADHWTTEAADQFNRRFEKYSWAFHNFRGKTGGYVAVALDGVWARAPYLHNGSVPSLRDLLEPPDSRPRMFYRGYDVFDATNVGFISNVASEGGRPFARFETSVPGNSNVGHEYGTELPAAEKKALIEYLKML